MTAGDFPDFATPQAHATAIAATGVPLLSAPGTLITALLQNVAANGGTLTQFATFTQVGYALNIITSFPAAATNPFVEVALIWTDAVSGTVYDEAHYFVPGASGASGFTVLANGIVKSSRLEVIVTNLDAAQAATVSLLVAQDSVSRDHDRWYFRNAADNGLAVQGQTVATLLDDELTLGLINAVNVALSSNTTWMFGMAPGRLVQVSGFMSSSAALDYNLQVRPVPSGTYTSSGYLLYLASTATSFNGTFLAPRAPVSVKVTNNSPTAAVNVHLLLTAQD